MNDSEKNGRKKKASIVTASMIICCAILAVLLIIMLADRSGSSNDVSTEQNTTNQLQMQQAAFLTKNEASQTEPAETVPTQTERPSKTFEVVSDYGIFLLSGYWKGEMRAEIIKEDVYTIRAYCLTGSQKEKHVFDVCFGGNEGEFIGYVLDQNECYQPVYIVLSIFEPDGTWSDSEKRDFYGMQSEINSIIDQLALVDELPNSGGEDAAAVVEVQTSYFSLHYPARFAEWIRTEVEEGESVSVSFYGTPSGMEELHLFDIQINGDSELPVVGYYTAADGAQIPVHVCNLGEYSMVGWDEQAVLQMNEMMECVNDILFALEQSGSFSY